MKNFLKCSSLILALMIVFSFQIVKADGSVLSIISLQDAQDTVNYAIDKVGGSYTSGYCLGFVTSCWKNTYGNDWPANSKCCAYQSYKSFKESTSRDDIPEGATVYFKDTYGKITYCGSHAAGHAGIYVGDNELVHIWGGKTVKTSISYVENSGYQYLGWGYPGGIEIETEPPSPENSELKINLTTYPTKLSLGSSHGLRGTITSNYKITLVTGKIYKGNTKVLSTSQEPYSKKLDIASSNLNSDLKFGKLDVGNYRLVFTAEDLSGKQITFEKEFSVYKVASELKINLTSYPTTITKGKGFGLRGSITSNYALTAVRGYVFDSSGDIKLSSKDTPNSKTLNIRYSDLNNSLTFGKLPAGKYTLEIRALDKSGKIVKLSKSFTVK